MSSDSESICSVNIVGFVLGGWRVKILRWEMTAIGKEHRVDHSAI